MNNTLAASHARGLWLWWMAAGRGLPLCLLSRLQLAVPARRPSQPDTLPPLLPCLPAPPSPSPRCRDVIAPQVAPRVLQEEPNPKYENFVAGSVSVGSRANVAAGTMVGADSALEDRTSVKRSVVGQGCHLGAGSKVGSVGKSGAGQRSAASACRAAACGWL